MESSASLGHTVASLNSLGSGNATNRMAGGAMTSFAATLVGRLFQLVSQVIFAKALGIEDYGRFALGMVFVRLLGSISPLGMGRVAIVLGSQTWRSAPARFKGIVFATIGIAGVSGVLMATGLVLAGTFGTRPPALVDMPSLSVILFATVVPGFAVLRVVVDLTLVSQKVMYRALTESVAQPVIALIGFAILYFVVEGLDAAIAASAISFAASCIIGLGCCATLFGRDLAKTTQTTWDINTILKFAGPAWLAATFGVVHSLLDRIVVGSFVAAEHMAIYHAASQVSVAFLMIMGSLVTIFMPMAASAHAQQDMDTLRNLFQASARWGLYLGLPLFTFLHFTGGQLLVLTFGPEYQSGETTLTLLALGQLADVGTGAVGAVLLVSGNQVAWMLASGIGALVNGAIGFALVPTSGIEGAAVAKVAGNVAMFGSALVFVKYRLGIWPYERSVWKLSVATIMASAAGALMASLPYSMPAVVVATGFAIFGSFAATLIGLGLESAELEIWSAIRRRIKRRDFLQH